MSGIAGYWYLDGRPADPRLLERMTSVVAHRGPDGVHHWRSADRSVGLGHLAFWTTPEAVHEQQPLPDESGACVLVFDGRLDNREELRRELASREAVLRDDTDAELVLKSYLVWGEDAPRRLLGDFAFAVWDGRVRRFFCARDVMGIKPLYYYRDGQRFLFGSQVRQLLADPSVPKAPDEVAAAARLTGLDGMEQDRTLFREIRRLQPAQQLVVDERGARPSAYWEMVPTRVPCSSEREYAAHFRQLLREAVRCRMRHHGRLGAELSGGLDSSSVVGMAQVLIRDGTVPDPGFESFSWVFPGHRCDESEYIEAVVARWNLQGLAHRLHAVDDPARHDYHDDVVQSWDAPTDPNGAIADSAWRLARERGFRVLLTGQGGDASFTGSPYLYVDLLRRAKLHTLHSLLRLEKSPPATLWRHGLRPLLGGLLPPGLQGWRRLRGFRWIDRSFAWRTGLPARLAAPLWGRVYTAAGERVGAYKAAFLYLENGDRYGPRYGLEDRHPFYDRRLLELALSMPDHYCWRVGESKRIMRQALGDVLPAKVRARQDKAEFSLSMAVALARPDVAGAFESLALERLGWVRGDELRRALALVLAEHREGRELYVQNPRPVWLAYALELWYRTVFLADLPAALAGTPRAGCNTRVPGDRDGKA